jgi:subtilisin family serine protease
MMRYFAPTSQPTNRSLLSRKLSVSLSLATFLVACKTTPPPSQFSHDAANNTAFRIQTISSANVKTTILANSRFIRQTQKPFKESRVFSLSAQDLQRRFLLTVVNGPSTYNKVSSAVVKINGETVLNPQNLNAQVADLSIGLANLQVGENTVEVELESKPNSAIEMQIDGFALPQNTLGAVHSLIPDTPEIRKFIYTPGRLGIKFLEGLKIRLQTSPSGTVSFTDLQGTSLKKLNDWLKQNKVKAAYPALGLSAAEMDQDEQRAEALMQTDIPNLGLFYFLEVDPKTDLWPLIDSLRALPMMEEAFPEFETPAQAIPLPTDPVFQPDASGNYPKFTYLETTVDKSQWLRNIHVLPNRTTDPGPDDPGAWSITQGVPQVKIAIIDGGFQHPRLGFANTHEDLGNVLLFNNMELKPSIGLPDVGHGQGSIGIVGASANNGKGGAGIAHGATVIAISHGTEIPLKPKNEPLKSLCRGTFAPTGRCDSNADSIYLAHKVLGAKVIGLENGGGDECETVVIEQSHPVVRAAVAAAVANGTTVLVPASNNSEQDVRKFVRDKKTYFHPDTGSIIVGGVRIDGSDIDVLGCEKPKRDPKTNEILRDATGKILRDPVIPKTYNYGPAKMAGANGWYSDPNVGHGIDVSGPSQFKNFSTFYASEAPHLNNLYAGELSPTPRPNGALGYDQFAGTSAATPMVAGIAALMLSVKPDLTPLEIRKTLRVTRGRTPGEELTYSHPTKSGIVTAGIVNAYAALSTYVNPGIPNQPGLVARFYADSIVLPPDLFLNSLELNTTLQEMNVPYAGKVLNSIDAFPSNGNPDPFAVGLKQFYVADFQGVISVPTTGRYQFALAHNAALGDGGILEIDGEHIIDSSLRTDSPQAESGLMTLSQGDHQIRVSMYQTQNSVDLALLWRSDPTNPQTKPYERVPDSVLSHLPTLAQNLPTAPPPLKPKLIGRFFKGAFNPPYPVRPPSSPVTPYTYLGNRLFEQIDYLDKNKQGDQFGIGEVDNFTGLFSGRLVLPPGYPNGYYRFKLAHDDGAQLFLENQLLIDKFGFWDLTIHTSPDVFLEQGKPYPFLLVYQEFGHESEVQLSWVKPDGTEEVIPADAYKHY